MAEAKTKPPAGNDNGGTDRKVALTMALCMGTVNSLVMSFAGPLLSGHFTWGSWVVGFIIGWVIGFAISFIVPIGKISGAVCRRFKAAPNTFAARVLNGLTASLIMTPVMSLVMCSVMMNISLAGLEKGIAASQNELSETVAEREQTFEEIDEALVKLDEMLSQEEPPVAEIGVLRGSIEGLNQKAEGLGEKIGGLTESIASRKASAQEIRGSMAASVIRSEIVMNIIGFVLNTLIQPFILAFAIKTARKQKTDDK